MFTGRRCADVGCLYLDRFDSNVCLVPIWCKVFLISTPVILNAVGLPVSMLSEAQSP
jgi:hypothetical protein